VHSVVSAVHSAAISLVLNRLWLSIRPHCFDTDGSKLWHKVGRDTEVKIDAAAAAHISD
jgi:hypothetical protein